MTASLTRTIALATLLTWGLPAADILPDQAARAAGVEALRTTYREALQGTPDRRIAFAGLQLERAADPALPPAETAARLTLAAEIARSVGRIDIIIKAARLVVGRFGDAQTLELRRSWLATMTQASAKAALTLIDHPEDQAANDTLGSYYFLSIQDESEAIACWSRGLGRRQQIATLELNPPTTPAAIADLADLWYEEGHAASLAALRLACYAKAQACYRRATEGAGDALAAHITGQLADIARLLPDDPKDWGRLSASQWAALKGDVVRVKPVKDPSPIGITLKEGQHYRLVPHPTDTWVLFAGGVAVKPTYRGVPPPVSVGTKFQTKPPEFGAMRLWADGRRIEPGVVVDGPAAISCSVDMVGVDAENSVHLNGDGIRVKVVLVPNGK